MQRYPPSPVSMQVALLAQGLDEHWRASERQGGKLKQRKKKKKRKAVFRSCVPSLLRSLPRSLPPSTLLLCLRLCFSSLAPRVHTTSVLSPENKTENETWRGASRSYAAAKNKRRSVDARIEAKLSREPEKNFSSSFISLFFRLAGEIFICDNDPRRRKH